MSERKLKNYKDGWWVAAAVTDEQGTGVDGLTGGVLTEGEDAGGAEEPPKTDQMKPQVTELNTENKP